MYTVAQPGAGVKLVKVHPTFQYWGPIFDPAIMYCNISLSKFSKKKRFTCSGGPSSVLKGSIFISRANSRLKRAHHRPERGALES